MFGVCLGYADSYEEAKDLLQEGFIKVFRNIHKCSEDGSLGGWIRRVIVNNNIDHYRANKRQQETQELDEVHLNSHYQEAEEVDIGGGFGQKEFLELIQCLPSGYRMVLNLYLVEGYQHQEIAQRLGISVQTSKSQYCRAKRLLRKKFGSRLKERLLAVI